MPVQTILSPLPGIFYRRPSPNDPMFKDVGDAVAVGDALGLIEVMKSFTPLTAEVAGRISAFLVEEEAAVMPGEPLIEIEV